MRISWAHYPGADALAAAAPASTPDSAPAACVFAFVSSQCDLPRVAQALAATGAPIISCTSAGQLGAAGFEQGGITAAVVHDGLAVRSFLVRSLKDLDRSLDETASAILATGALDVETGTVVGLVLSDGLSGVEARLMAGLHQRLPMTPIVGGSASDDLRFERASVYWDGQYLSDAAVLHLIATDLPITPLRFQHHRPTEHRLVVTRTSDDRRTVHELNGIPAVQAYAEALGLTPREVTAPVASSHPLLLRIGGEYYTRSIRRLTGAGALELYGTIEPGLVVRVGQTHDIVGTTAAAFAAARERVGEPALVIGCDCVLRRLEIQRAGLARDVGQILTNQRVIGFSAYGEQINGLHVTHSFTGFMFGAHP